MTKESAKNELVYQMTMYAARKMLKEGLITKDEYGQFETKMRSKICPVFGTILSGNDLL